MKKLIFILLGLCLLHTASSDLLAQRKQKFQDVPEYVKKRKAYKRAQWFYEQRMAPDGTLPEGIYWAERDRVIQEQRVLSKAKGIQRITWQTIGPHGVNALPSHWGITSGRVRGLAVHPTNSNIVYIGAAAGGIWKTTDGGDNWTPLGENLESLTFGAIAIDPQNPETIYAGTGEVRFNFGNNIYDGKGLFKSTDGGQTWIEPTTQFGPQTHFAALRVDPFNSDTVYAALASGYTYVSSPGNEGIWVSANGGQNWTRTLVADDAFEVLPHPTRNGHVYCGIGGGQANLSGVWFSNDNGQTWAPRNNGLPVGTTINRIHLAIPSSTPTRIYAVIFPSNGITRVFRSIDSGNSWSQIATGLGGITDAGAVDQGGYDLCIAVNPDNAGEVYVGNVELHRSSWDDDTNDIIFSAVRQGFGWFNAWDSPMHVDYHAIVYAPSNPQCIYVGCDGGIYRSTDGGSSWNSLNDGINTLQFYRIASNPDNVNMLIGGAQDNGIIGNQNAGVALRWGNLSTGDGFECFFDPTNPNIVYASTQNVGLVKSTSGMNGLNFVGIPVGSIVNGIPDNERNLIFQAPFFMHPTNPNILFTATTRPYRTTNGGDNWTALSAPLVSNTTTTIQTMSISPGNPQFLICAASNQAFVSSGVSNSVFVSTDGGSNWTNRTGPLPNRFVTRVVTHPHQDSTMFVVMSGFGAGQKVYRTPDLGLTWVNISGNLPNVPHSDLFIDPHIPDNLTMYVANDLGVYSTNDGGAFWRRDSDGMPIVPAIDFDYHWGERILHVATHGRSVFRANLPLSALALMAPNGGENFAVDAEYEIRWLGNGFANPDNVRLEYSLNNGRSWQAIAFSTPNTGSFRWRVPATISTGTDSALVRVINPEDNDIMDESNAVFKIFVDPQFAVISTGQLVNNKGTFTGASWADYDNDEFLDIAVTSEHPTEPPLRLYRNSRVHFSDVTSSALGTFSFPSFTSTWGDFDKDSDLDLLVAGLTTKLFRNNGSGTFTDATSTAIPDPDLTEVTSASWADWNRDNQLDLFVTTGGSSFAAGRRNVLYGQVIPGILTTDFLDGNFDSRGQAWGDFNNDGYPDLFIANYGQNNLLYKVVKNGNNIDIVRVTTGAIVNDGGNSNAGAWGDIDNDGDLDLFVANDGQNFLYRNNGNETFTRDNIVAPGRDAGNSKTCAWGDFDNDGDLDLFVGNDGQNFLYSNTGGASFQRVSLSAVTTTDDYTNGAAWGDYDNDGNLDLLIANGVVGTSNTENNILYHNKGSGNNWLNVKLHGVVSNFSGIGARVRISYNVDGASRRQIREITGQTGKGQNSMVAHFGLGSATTIDSLIVQWPSRTASVLTNVTANQQITIYERTDNFVKVSAGDLAAASGDFLGSAWGDYNNDGFADLFLADSDGNNALYKNRGDGSFIRITDGPGSSTGGSCTGGSWGDYDNDGNLDLYVTNNGVNFLYRNEGPPDFDLIRITTGPMVTESANSTASSWGDFDSDGDVDLFVANQGTNAQNFLYRNSGNSQFVRITTGAVATQFGSATGCAWVDFDNDGDLDLFVTYSDHSDVLYRNTGAPNFDFSRVSTGEIVTDATPSKGCSWSDYDNDGDMDVYVIKNGKNRLYRNNGNGAFTRITQGEIVNDEADSRSSAWGDKDSDGYLDLVVFNPTFNALYIGTFDGTFAKNLASPIVFTRASHSGGSWADYDNDGDLDLYVPSGNYGTGSLFQNTESNVRWLEVQLIGSASNKSALGARVRVKAQVSTKLSPFWQTREISGQTGTGSQNHLVLYFGLGEAAQVDSLIVDWPRSSRLVLTNLAVNQRLVLREQRLIRFAVIDNSPVIKEKTVATGGTWADVDNDGDQDLFVTTKKGPNLLFINSGNGDFKKITENTLVKDNLPSTASAWADVNNDGALDVFVANYDALGVLYLNKGNGDFTPVTGGDISKDQVKATGCSWGDFDNDGLVDLFVATEKAPNLLYHNEGGGTFRKITSGDIVKENLDSRAGAWADYDNDGDLDLFVANYNDKNALYRNDGNGTFVRVLRPPFDTDVGASVGCSWGDFDNDGDLDLFITNDGGSNFFYRNDHSAGRDRFVKITDGPVATDIGKSTGSSWVDFDNDGDLDLFVSDFGGGNRLYHNLGSPAWAGFERSQQEKITEDKSNSQGNAWADIDGDGDLDLFVANSEQENFFYRNEGNPNHWINIALVGMKTNAAGIGAKVRVKAMIDGLPVWQMHEISAQTGGGFSGQNSLNVEFGLGNAAKLDSIIIHWPSGIAQTLTSVASNQFIKIVEEGTTAVEQEVQAPMAFRLHPVYPNPFNPSTTIRYELAEPSRVSITVYNLMGEAVEELVRTVQTAGAHETVWHAHRLASGVYIIKMTALSATSHKTHSQIQKALLLR